MKNLKKTLFWLFKISSIILIALTLIAVSLYIFLSTQSGSTYVIKKIAAHQPGQLSIQKFSGDLLHQFKIERLDYENNDYKLAAQNIAIKWQPWKLAFKLLAIDTLQVKKITLTKHLHRIEKTSPSSPAKHHILPRIQLDQLQIDEIVYLQEKKLIADIKNIRLKNNISQKQPLNLNAEATITKPLTGKINLTAKGKPTDYTFKINLNFTPLNWQINGKGNQQQASFTTNTGKFSAGKFNVSGNFQWQPQLTAKLNANLNQLDLNALNFYLPLISSAKLEMNYAANQLSWNISQANLIYPEKHAMQLNANGNFDFQADQGNSKIKLQAPNNRIDLNFSMQKQIQADWNLSLQQLHQILPYAEGTIQSQGKIIWPAHLWPKAKDHFLVESTAKISNLKLFNTQVKAADIKAKIDSAVTNNLDVMIHANQVFLFNWHLQQLIFHTQGNLNQQIFQLKLKSGKLDALINGNGAYQKQAWQGKIQDFIIHIENYGDWKNLAAFPLNFGAHQLQIGAFCLAHQTSQLCSELNWQKDQIHFQSKLNTLPLMPLLRALKTPLITDSNLSFTANLNANSTKQSGSLQLQLSPGKILARNNMQRYALHQAGAEVSAKLDQRGFKSEIRLRADSQPLIIIDWGLPDYQIMRGLSDEQKISGKFFWQTTDLNFLPLLIPNLTEAKGKLNLNANLTGTIGAPIIAGELNLTNGSAYLAEQNITIAPIAIAIKGKQSQLSYLMNAISGGGKIVIDGSSKLNSIFESQFNIKGSNFLASDTNTLQLRVSPDLKMNLDTEQVNIKGNILIPDALIAPVDFNDVVSLPDDVQIIRDQQQNTGTPWLTNLDIALIAGNNVIVNAMRLKGRVTGKVQVKQVASKALTGEGVLTIVNGSYDLFGRKLMLSQAQLLFNNSLITNPALNVRATQRIKTQATLQNFSQQVQTVGINIQGTAENPNISLFSQPAGLSQADILSLIVIGQPTALAKGSETQLLFRAAQALTPAGTPMGNLQQQLQQTLGLSEISVKSLQQYDKSSNKVTNNTALVLGKYLSPRLYLNYSIGLIDPVNILRVRYYLSRKWAVQTETSVEGSGGDVFYSFER